MRKYKSGSGWAFWRWTEVYIEGDLYLRRLHILKTPWGAVMLHWLRPDPYPDMHDHPASFVSFILRGAYVESRKVATPHGTRVYHRTWFNRVKATDAHRLIAVISGTLSLVFVGPTVREWGYHTPKGWIPWKQYREERSANLS